MTRKVVCTAVYCQRGARERPDFRPFLAAHIRHPRGNLLAKSGVQKTVFLKTPGTYECETYHVTFIDKEEDRNAIDLENELS